MRFSVEIITQATRTIRIHTRLPRKAPVCVLPPIASIQSRRTKTVIGAEKAARSAGVARG